MSKTMLIVGILSLFIGTSMSSSTGFAINSMNHQQLQRDGVWLYVGGSGPNNFSVIQYAVDNASDGDTIFVYNGVYSDYFADNSACVFIDKRIILLGEDREQTIISGPGFQRVIFIDSSDVVVSGFTLQYGGTPEHDGTYGCGIFLFQRITNVHIYDNTIKENHYGIAVEFDCTNVYIHDNVITGNYQGFDNAPNNHNIEIYNNIISENTEGLNIFSDDWSVHHNQVMNNLVGIVLYGCRAKVMVAQNHIQNNTMGMRVWISRVTIQENNFIDNTFDVDLYTGLPVSLLPLALFFPQRWKHNFWDEWMSTKPRPIPGTLGVFIIIPFPKWFAVEIASIGYDEYDWHPAQEPYDIPAMIH